MTDGFPLPAESQGHLPGVAARGAPSPLTLRPHSLLSLARVRDEPVTLEELSKKYDVSRERVRQIEMRAFDKLQAAMKAALADKRSQTLEAAH
jgi:RNA polymerase sigma-32 factor